MDILALCETKLKEKMEDFFGNKLEFKSGIGERPMTREGVTIPVKNE